MCGMIAALLIAVLPVREVATQTVKVCGSPIVVSMTDLATGATVAMSAAALPGATTDTKGQVLRTVITDPMSGDPYEVETTRGITETMGSFWDRHDEMVDFVKKKLGIKEKKD